MNIKERSKINASDLSALCEHSVAMDHIISWTDTKILELETDYRKRLFFESWHINAKPLVMNRNDGSSFPAVYLDLLKLLSPQLKVIFLTLCFRLTTVLVIIKTVV